MDLPAIIARVTDGHVLTEEEAESAFRTIMAGEATPVGIAAFLAALRTRGHAPPEVAGGVRALRAEMLPVSPGRAERHPDGTEVSPLVDTCGTGGGSVTTFNISTAAALVAAAAGVRVAKHGNRSFTSRSGSADVLEALGVTIQLSPEAMGKVLEEVGIVFMFAPLLHPAMRHVAGVRRELGIPTIMNLLGPLTNPAGVRRQVVGVSDPALIPLISEALQALGHDRALVVHGEAGMDEVSPLGSTRVTELRGGELTDYRIDPEALGLPIARAEEIAGGEPEDNARIIRSVFEGRDRGGARTVVLLNAAATLLVAGVVEDFGDGVERSALALDSGAATDTLARLIEASGRMASRAEPTPT